MFLFINDLPKLDAAVLIIVKWFLFYDLFFKDVIFCDFSSLFLSINQIKIMCFWSIIANENHRQIKLTSSRAKQYLKL